LKQGFNFLKPQVEPPSVWSRVYEWVVGTARIILVVAEVGVILALFIRVVIDIQGKQLDDQIANLEAVMQVLQPDEFKYRNLQQRIESYETVWTNGKYYTPVMTLINSSIPKTALDIEIKLTGNILQISGRATNPEIKQMENDLKTSPYFIKTKLTSLDVSDTKLNAKLRFTFDTEVRKIDPKVLLSLSPTPTVIPTN
jgi:Tfp pilus assembly protein PilN